MTTLQKKSFISLKLAAIFLIVSLPLTYKLADKVVPIKLFDEMAQCPTFAGRLLHTLVFFVITYLSMLNADLETTKKIEYSIYSTLFYFFISSPSLYSFVGKIIPGVSDNMGCPTNMGILLHSFVYFLALLGVMYL